ncbi:hypothetical protein GCM10009584_11800 [Ornithinimicrobium humiphilum]|uniref:Capsular polysaccharide synthesis protein n=1 Tax=Ornithinimicrobium humiphilum TaxID=125288 RepID=A0A543KJM8_9MICO|nr:glycosyltransferase [Ornithinimicrobium humiphilum]TQM95283.1 capsular polysaccharide synthesis protein [Ornithinimicrobium humiphilum]
MQSAAWIKTRVGRTADWLQDSGPVIAAHAAGARLAARISPSTYWPGRYPHTFLERQPPADARTDGDVPDVIWCCWTGDNPLTPARKAGLESIRALHPDIPVRLVTPANLHEVVLPEHPLHPAYEFLSLNHRSDYLRAYLLYHHGGAYTDIKTLRTSWAPAFARLRGRPDAWVLATALTDPKWAGNPPGRLGSHVRRYYQTILSGGTLMARAGNPLLAEWLREIDRRLDYGLPALQECPGDTWGEDPRYCFEWMDLQGNILQPLCLKYQDHLVIDATLAWDEETPYR